MLLATVSGIYTYNECTDVAAYDFIVPLIHVDCCSTHLRPYQFDLLIHEYLS